MWGCSGKEDVLWLGRKVHPTDCLLVLVTGLLSGPRTKCPTELWPRWSGGAVLASRGATAKRVSHPATHRLLQSTKGHVWIDSVGWAGFVHLLRASQTQEQIAYSLHSSSLSEGLHTRSKGWSWKSVRAKCLQISLKKKKRNKEMDTQGCPPYRCVCIWCPHFRKCVFTVSVLCLFHICCHHHQLL